MPTFLGYSRAKRGSWPSVGSGLAPGLPDLPGRLTLGQTSWKVDDGWPEGAQSL